MSDDQTFQGQALLQLDRIERAAGLLKDQLRAADEFLAAAHGRVNELLQNSGPGLPQILVQNEMPQSVGLSAGWSEDGQFVIKVTHRGDEYQQLIMAGQEAQIEVPSP